jgi:hypothetical protein
MPDEFDPTRNQEPCVPTKVLKEWALGKLMVSAAEGAALEAAPAANTEDTLRQGLEHAVQRGGSELLREFLEEVVLPYEEGQADI